MREFEFFRGIFTTIIIISFISIIIIDQSTFFGKKTHAFTIFKYLRFQTMKLFKKSLILLKYIFNFVEFNVKYLIVKLC